MDEQTREIVTEYRQNWMPDLTEVGKHCSDDIHVQIDIDWDSLVGPGLQQYKYYWFAGWTSGYFRPTIAGLIGCCQSLPVREHLKETSLTLVYRNEAGGPGAFEYPHETESPGEISYDTDTGKLTIDKPPCIHSAVSESRGSRIALIIDS